MTIDEIKTLEDLKKFYEQETKKAYESGMEDPQSYLFSITDQFDLNDVEFEYVTESSNLTFAQSNHATMNLYQQVMAMASTTPVRRKK